MKIFNGLLGLFLGIFFVYIPQFGFSLDKKLYYFNQIQKTQGKEKLLYLDSLAWEYMYVNPDSTIYYSDKAIEQNTISAYSLLKANSFNTKGVAYIVKGEYNTAISQIDKAIEIGQDLIENEEDKSVVQRRLLSYYTNLGNCYYYFGEFEVTVKNYLKALEYAKAIKFSGIATIYSNLGVIYDEMNKNELAIKYQHKAFAEAYKNNDLISMGQSMNNIGSVYSNVGNHDSAFVYFRKGLSYYEKAGEAYESITSYINLGQEYSEKEMFDSAYFYLSTAAEKSMKIGYTDGMIYYYIQMGGYYQKQDSLGKALQNYLKCYDLADNTGGVRRKYIAAQKISDLYYHLQNYKAAYDYLHISDNIQDSIFSAESDQRIANLEVKYQVKEKEMEIKALEVQKEKDSKFMSLLYLLIVVTVLAAAFVSWFYIKKRKSEKDKALVEKRLIASELEKSNLKHQEAVTELEFKTKQLTTHALNIMQKNNMLMDLMEPISEAMKYADSELHQKLKVLKRKIKTSLKVDKDWDVFKMYFEQVNADFFEKLKQINPDLTSGDLKMAALSFLNLNIKETSSVLNLAPNSVKSSRYHLRKKLGVPSGEALADFLNKVSV